MSAMTPYWRRNVAILASKCRMLRHTGLEMSAMIPYWHRNVGYDAILAPKCRHTGVEMSPYWHRNVAILASKCRHTGIEMAHLSPQLQVFDAKFEESRYAGRQIIEILHKSTQRSFFGPSGGKLSAADPFLVLWTIFDIFGSHCINQPNAFFSDPLGVNRTLWIRS